MRSDVLCLLSEFCFRASQSGPSWSEEADLYAFYLKPHHENSCKAVTN